MWTGLKRDFECLVSCYIILVYLGNAVKLSSLMRHRNDIFLISSKSISGSKFKLYLTVDSNSQKTVRRVGKCFGKNAESSRIFSKPPRRFAIIKWATRSFANISISNFKTERSPRVNSEFYTCQLAAALHISSSSFIVGFPCYAQVGRFPPFKLLKLVLWTFSPRD